MRLAVPGSPKRRSGSAVDRVPAMSAGLRRSPVQRGTFQEFRMGRTLSLFGVVMFAFGVVALSSLARRTQPAASTPCLPEEDARGPEVLPRRIMPAFAFDTPFSMN
jgi:hypothetical protein